VQENDAESFSGSDNDIMKPTGVPGMFIEECNGWDMCGGGMDGQFYEAKLKKSIGPFPIGSVLDTVEFNLYDVDEPLIRIYHNKKIVEVKITVESDDVWVTTDQVEVSFES